MNFIDKTLAFFSPVAGLKRAQARHALNVVANYEAAKSNRMRKKNRDSKSSNNMVENDAAALRGEARHLQRNHDLSRGAIRVLVNNIVGQHGIGIEPQPRMAGSNEIHEEYARQLREAWKDWCIKPEVTHKHSFAKVQRLVAASWIRDGEGFAQMLSGPVQFLDHGTAVPFSLELFEADMLPLNYNDTAKGIRQGIELNTWGRPRAAWVFKQDPLETYQVLRNNDLKRIPWENILHIAAIDRIGQLRGVSEFASVITRLLDIKDYEESERIAAKIAASLTAYIKKGDASMYGASDATSTGSDGAGTDEVRDFSMQAGMIIDGLEVGEEVGMIDSNRPNPNVVTWRQGQLKAFAAGLGGSYSSISRDYDGNYSSQRQELIEQWVHYAVLTDELVGQVIQPIWERFVDIAHRSGVVPRPNNLVPLTFDDALFVGQSMPWIDPLKEAIAAKTLVRAGFTSEVNVIRKRGENPKDVLDQIASFRTKAKDKSLVFDSDASQTNGSGAAQPDAVNTNL
jgi:lambda family phage portal protein